MDALFGLVEGDSGEVMHRRDVSTMRRNISFSSQNFSHEAVVDVGVVVVLERFDRKFREFSLANDFVINSHYTKISPRRFQVQEFRNPLANHVSVGAGIDHGVDDDAGAGMRAFNPDCEDGPDDVVSSGDGSAGCGRR